MILQYFASSKINFIQDGLFRGCSQMCWGWGGGVGGAKMPPSLKSVTHILQWWNLVQLYLTWKNPKKYMYYVTLPLSSTEIHIFSPEISKFCHIKKCMYRLHFDTKFLILLTFLESSKILLMKKQKFWWCHQKWLPQVFLKQRYFEIKIMTS